MAKVLLVDDDPGVLYETSRLVANAGHSILLAFGGLAAIETYRRNKRWIDAVLMDVVMPELDGVVAFHMIRHQRPDVPVVFILGGADSLSQELRTKPGVALLQKPFEFSDLVDSLDQVLAGNAGSDRTQAGKPVGADEARPPGPGS